MYCCQGRAQELAEGGGGGGVAANLYVYVRTYRVYA